MTISVRSCLLAGVAVVTASALVVASSLRPPAPESVASPAIRLSVAVQPLTTPSDNIPSLVDEIRMGIVPSLGAPFPTPMIPGPSPAPTDFNSLIKNTYNAIEPWVQYGFELVTWGVGWIPWVGWLAPQIMIFYFFGERIAHSDVWNLDDWLWGSLPFVQGYINNATDKWNALVQLGIDQLNFWLPGLPPLPFAAQQTRTLAANLATAQIPASSPQTPLVSPPTPGATLFPAAKLAGQPTTAPTGVVTSTTVVTAKSSSSPTATETDSPKPQITKPATGLSDTLRRDGLKLTNAPATTGQGGPSHHADDKMSAVPTGTANSGKPLPVTQTQLKKK